MTARWVVERVAPERDVEVAWEPISLFFKNNPAQGDPGHAEAHRGHELLRVMESVRTEYGNEGVGASYWAFATAIHHDGALRTFDVGRSLAHAGLDPRHADAQTEAAWDSEIRARMEIGLSLAGRDVGTPIMGFEGADGKPVAFFGPVITRVPDDALSLRLWDGLLSLVSVPGFWELKRGRQEPPDLGHRPDQSPHEHGVDADDPGLQGAGE